MVAFHHHGWRHGGCARREPPGRSALRIFFCCKPTPSPVAKKNPLIRRTVKARGNILSHRGQSVLPRPTARALGPGGRQAFGNLSGRLKFHDFPSAAPFLHQPLHAMALGLPWPLPTRNFSFQGDPFPRARPTMAEISRQMPATNIVLHRPSHRSRSPCTRRLSSVFFFIS